MKLTKKSTAELVKELSQREGVRKLIVYPYEKKSLNIEGPCIILIIED